MSVVAEIESRAVAGATGFGVAGHAIARVRSYLSTQHLFAAELFARLAADFEGDHAGGPQRIYLQHRAYAMGSVLESVAFLEAYVNEIYQDAAEGRASATDGLPDCAVAQLAAYWTDHARADLLVKYRMARLLVGAPAADAGRRPHDDVVYVIRLRNWLVHNKPRDRGDDSPDQLIDHVRGRFPENPFLGNAQVSWFPEHALSAGCAQWALASVRAFVDEFVTAIGCTRTHHRLEHDEQP
jgi:hypothetical protein